MLSALLVGTAVLWLSVDIEKEMDDLKSRIKDKQGEVKLLTSCDQPVQKFRKKADAEKRIDKISTDAQNIKDKAELKQLKDKDKGPRE